jgi:glycosyltransferase involved in cell wall biosynthesis
MIKITIGIPALNEEKNIGLLLQSIANQSSGDYIIDKVIVVSDGSTDKTVEIAKAFTDKLQLQIIINPERIGQAQSQNKIFDYSDSNYVLLLNADVLPADNNFLSEIAKQVNLHKNIDLWGIDVRPVKSVSFFESVLNFSHTWKTEIYKTINRQDNLYLCFGRARVFSSRLYKQLRWPPVIAEDTYSYLYAKSHNFKFMYLDQTHVVFRCPQSLKGHLKQSVRFLKSKEIQRKHFDENFVQTQYHIPARSILYPSIRQFTRKPLHALAFVFLLSISKIKAAYSQNTSPLWSVSEDSKQLHN